MDAGYHRAPRILVWDIESTNLSASFGTILCIGYKWYDEKAVHVPSILDHQKNADIKNYLNDRPVVEQFAKAYSECDYHVTWYGERFDLPMVRAKMVRLGLDPLPPKPHLDLWKTARRQFKIHSNRLAAWEQYLKCEHGKTAIEFDAWLAAAQGNKKAMAEVKDHCEKDVLVLEDVFRKFRPWMDNEPARGLFTGDHEGCPSCGSHNTLRQGVRMTVTRTYQRFQCRDCRHWFHSARSLETARLKASMS